MNIKKNILFKRISTLNHYLTNQLTNKEWSDTELFLVMRLVDTSRTLLNEMESTIPEYKEESNNV